LIPGEPEVIEKAIREKEGILIDDNTLAELRQAAEQLVIDLDLSPCDVSGTR
jgi:LDH2 family malate/lactate/ureidoglycolate dehydrogenase